MLVLRTLGRLTLQRHTGSPDALREVRVPSRTLALLAVLANSIGSSVSRDRLAALLWPESNDEAARNSLRQTLFRLKHQVGSATVGGVADLRLNDAEITSDVVEFREAYNEKRFEDAVRAYQGPFLDGFFVRGCDELERWTELQRQELRSYYTRALERLAEDAAATGAVGCELEWRRRLCTAEPIDARGAHSYMSALARTGNFTEALRHFAIYEQTLRKELDVAAPDELLLLARSLRVDRPAAVVAEIPSRSAEVAPPNDSISEGDQSRPPMVRAVTTRRWRIAVPVLSLAGLAAVGLSKFSPDRPRVVESITHVVVHPTSLDGETFRLERALAALLAARLGDVPGLRVRADNARPLVRANATRPDTSELTLALRLLTAGANARVVVESFGREARRGAPAAIDVLGDTVDLAAMADLAAYRLVPRLVHPELRVAVERAARSTASLASLKAFVHGEIELLAARFPSAAQALERAVALDTLFAYGYHRLAEVEDWNGRVDEMLARSRRGNQLAHNLAEHDRLLVTSVASWRAGDIDAAERGLRRLVTDYPEDLEGWYFLGEVQFHSSPLRGRSFARASDAFERVIAGGGRRRDVTVHLSRIAMSRGDAAAAESMWVALSDTLRTTDRHMWTMLDTSLGAVDRIERALQTSNSESYLWEMVERGSVYTGNIHAAARIARLLMRAPASLETRRGALLNVAVLEAARGRFRTADSLLARPDGLPPETFTLVRAALAAVPHSTLGMPTLWEIESRLNTWGAKAAPASDRNAPYNALDPRFRSVFADRLSLRTGRGHDTLGAGSLVAPGGNADDIALGRAYAGWLQAEHTLTMGDARTALRHLVDTEPQLSLGVMHTMLGAHAPIRWLRAELLRQTGQWREALNWYESMVGTTVFETPYLAPSRLESARLMERLGDRDGAVRHYRAFVLAWRECDVELRPMVAAAAARLLELHASSKRAP